MKLIEQKGWGIIYRSDDSLEDLAKYIEESIHFLDIAGISEIDIHNHLEVAYTSFGSGETLQEHISIYGDDGVIELRVIDTKTIMNICLEKEND